MPTIAESQQVIPPQLLYDFLSNGEVDQETWSRTASSSYLFQSLQESDPDTLKRIIDDDITISLSYIRNSVDPEVYKKHLPL